MNGTRTTPPRPLDVTTVLPQLGPLARTATRLHPRPGSPTPHDSSIGGPLLWPAGQPWLYCDKWHDGPVAPMVPVAQLYVRDIPQLQAPGRADLLQVLWCASEHPPDDKPPTELFWRTAADVTDILTAPPQPYDVDYDDYVPEPCVLAPEQITEYPDFLELSKELRQQLADESTWRAAGVELPEYYRAAPEAFYTSVLSVAPGWKVGGWGPWGLTDPIARFCITCGARMNPLLTIASNEWDSSNRNWAPIEDQAVAALGGPEAANPPQVQVSKGNHLQLYVCSAFPGSGHAHTDLIQ